MQSTPHSTIHQTAPINELLSAQTRTSENQIIQEDLQKKGFCEKSQGKEAVEVLNSYGCFKFFNRISFRKGRIILYGQFYKTEQKKNRTRASRNSNCISLCVYRKSCTGKTTVARLLAGIFKELGVLKKGQLVETDRSGLVAEYIGQTAVKTNKIIDTALDGVLFIDEAYTLAQGGSQDYGHEAIATLLKRMEDNRDRLIVVLAGYGSEMKTFIESNPGLRSRFNRYINFPDYTPNELLEIFQSYLVKQQYYCQNLH